MSCVTLVVVSWFTKPKPREQLKGVIWTRDALGLLPEERAKNRGFRNLTVWWAGMAILILGLYVFTNVQGRNTLWLEAEQITYEVSDGATAQVLEKGHYKKNEESFKMWTGKGELMFTPSADGDTLTFQVPIEEEGQYKIDALITMGPEYGQFKARVNGQPTTISYPVTEVREEGKKFVVAHEEKTVFNGRELVNSAAGTEMTETIAGEHVVQRLRLGTFTLTPGQTAVAFIATQVKDENSNIGVDQLMVTKLKSKK